MLPQQIITRDEQAMALALALAQEAADDGEVPVGAVVVLDGKVIGRGRNRQITDLDPSAHAEMLLVFMSLWNRAPCVMACWFTVVLSVWCMGRLNPKPVLFTVRCSYPPILFLIILSRLRAVCWPKPVARCCQLFLLNAEPPVNGCEH